MGEEAETVSQARARVMRTNSGRMILLGRMFFPPWGGDLRGGQSFWPGAEVEGDLRGDAEDEFDVSQVVAIWGNGLVEFVGFDETADRGDLDFGEFGFFFGEDGFEAFTAFAILGDDDFELGGKRDGEGKVPDGVAAFAQDGDEAVEFLEQVGEGFLRFFFAPLGDLAPGFFEGLCGFEGDFFGFARGFFGLVEETVEGHGGVG